MTYIIADPDFQNGVALKKILEGYEGLVCQGCFTGLSPAEKSIRKLPPDLAFIRSGNAELNAFRLADKLKECNPASKIIVTGDRRESAVDAFEHEADGFLLIPFDQSAVGKLVRSFGTVKKDTKQL